eukprot:2678892-Pleurochrysis_carterae.AAC.1
MKPLHGTCIAQNVFKVCNWQPRWRPPCSRGADAVQAATAAAVPTAAAFAPAVVATKEDEEDSAGKEGVLSIPLEGNSPVLDSKVFAQFNTGAQSHCAPFACFFLVRPCPQCCLKLRCC